MYALDWLQGEVGTASMGSIPLRISGLPLTCPKSTSLMSRKLSIFLDSQRLSTSVEPKKKQPRTRHVTPLPQRSRMGSQALQIRHWPLAVVCSTDIASSRIQQGETGRVDDQSDQVVGLARARRRGRQDASYG